MTVDSDLQRNKKITRTIFATGYSSYDRTESENQYKFCNRFKLGARKEFILCMRALVLVCSRVFVCASVSVYVCMYFAVAAAAATLSLPFPLFVSFIFNFGLGASSSSWFCEKYEQHFVPVKGRAAQQENLREGENSTHWNNE